MENIPKSAIRIYMLKNYDNILFRTTKMSSNVFTFSNDIDPRSLLYDIKSSVGSNVLSVWSVDNKAVCVSFSNPLLNTELSTFSNLIKERQTKDANETSVMSVINSIYTPLNAGGSWSGAFELVTPYSLIEVSIASSTSSAPEGLKAVFSSDNGSTPDSNVQSFTYSLSNSCTQQYFLNVPSFNTSNTYYKLAYLNNSSSNQTSFELTSRYVYYFTKNKEKRTICDTVTESDVCSINRSVLAGRWIDSYYNVDVTNDQKLCVDIPKSAFGLLKVQEDHPVIQIDYIYDLSTQIIDTSTANLGTVSASNTLAYINSGSATSSSAILQSKRVIKYKAGQGVNIMFTALFTAPGREGNIQLAGAGNTNNGYFFGYNGTRFGILRRSNGVDNWTYQTDWTVDRFDGTGPSRVKLNHGYGNVYRICYQWLGFGMITYMIEDPKKGEFLPVHRIEYANSNLYPSTLIPSFPMHFESKNTSNNTNVELKSACFCAMIEGTRSFLGLTYGADNTKVITSASVLTNVLTIRNKATYRLKPNFIPIFMRLLSVGSDGNKNSIVYIIREAVVAGVQSWQSISQADSVVEYDTVGTSVTGGAQIAVFTFGKLESRTQGLVDLDIFLNPGQSLTIAGKLTGVGSSEVSASLTWFEDR